MHYKVPFQALQVNEHAATLRLRRVDRDAHRVVVEAASGGRVELPSVPGAAEDALAGELIAAGLTANPLAHGAEAERAAVVGATVANTAQLAVHANDPDLSTADPGDDVAVALQVGERAYVLPLGHASVRPSRSP
jgi:hypothetical protein